MCLGRLLSTAGTFIIYLGKKNKKKHPLDPLKDVPSGG